MAVRVRSPRSVLRVRSRLSAFGLAIFLIGVVSDWKRSQNILRTCQELGFLL